jgi:hypothetical protein
VIRRDEIDLLRALPGLRTSLVAERDGRERYEQHVAAAGLKLIA